MRCLVNNIRDLQQRDSGFSGIGTNLAKEKLRERERERDRERETEGKTVCKIIIMNLDDIEILFISKTIVTGNG